MLRRCGGCCLWQVMKIIGRIIGRAKRLRSAIMKVWVLLLTKLKLNAGKIGEDARDLLLLPKIMTVK
jgi:hypothetical protein